MKARDIGKYLSKLRKYYAITQDELAEGYYTVMAICKLGKAYGIELPICEAVYQIVYEGKSAKSILTELFNRSLKNEF